jgi:hypothetical protein
MEKTAMQKLSEQDVMEVSGGIFGGGNDGRLEMYAGTYLDPREKKDDVVREHLLA